MSDVFGAALWGADYLLQLMSLGYSGVNLHGGSGHAQAVSVGGVFFGKALMKDLASRIRSRFTRRLRTKARWQAQASTAS